MRIKHLLLVLLLTVSINSQAQNKLFERLAKMENVTSVYVSKSMLQMMPNMNLDIDIDIHSLIGRLDGILILSSENKAISGIMKNATLSLANDKSYEILMKVKEDKSNICFYIKKKPDHKIAELVMLVDEENEFVIIQMIGNMTMQDIQNLAKGINAD